MEKAMIDKQDRRLIREQLDRLLGIWEGRPGCRIEDCMPEEIFACFSNFGKIFVRDGLKKKMELTAGSTVRLNVLQYNSSAAGDRAWQHAVIMGLIVRAGNHICFGGTFVNELVRKEGRWLFEKLRFELQSDDGFSREYLTEEGHIIAVPGRGDRTLMTGWKMVNDRVGYFMDPVKEQGEHMILGEEDAPWNCAAEPEDEKDDSECVEEVFDRFCFAYDFSTLMLMKDILADDVVIRSKNAGDLNKHDALGYFRILRQGSPRSFLAGSMAKLKIEEDTAVCEVTCYSPERYLAEQSGGGECWCDACIYGNLTFQFRKEAGKWMINEAAFF